MWVKKHHFSVPLKDGKFLHAFVPDQGTLELANNRVKADDPIWSGDGVKYHGLINFFEQIQFNVHDLSGDELNKLLVTNLNHGDEAV